MHIRCVKQHRGLTTHEQGRSSSGNSILISVISHIDESEICLSTALSTERRLSVTLPPLDRRGLADRNGRPTVTIDFGAGTPPSASDQN